MVNRALPPGAANAASEPRVTKPTLATATPSPIATGFAGVWCIQPSGSNAHNPNQLSAPHNANDIHTGSARSTATVSALLFQLLGHVDPIIALLADPMHLDEPDARIKRKIFGHHLVCIQSYLGKPLPACLGLREFDQRAPISFALTLRQYRDVIQQEALWRLLQHQNSCDLAGIF